jgi:predicted nucleic acid-binding Zn ribbon protein
MQKGNGGEMQQLAKSPITHGHHHRLKKLLIFKICPECHTKFECLSDRGRCGRAESDRVKWHCQYRCDEMSQKPLRRDGFAEQFKGSGCHMYRTDRAESQNESGEEIVKSETYATLPDIFQRRVAAKAFTKGSGSAPGHNFLFAILSRFRNQKFHRRDCPFAGFTFSGLLERISIESLTNPIW